MIKPVHIFDVDLTVVRKTSAQYFIFLALKEKVIKFSHVSRLPFDWIKYKLAKPDMNFIENTVKKLTNINKEDLERVSQICFEKKIKPNVYKGAAQIITEAKKKGETVIFATSSFDFIIKPLEIFFNIEGSIASELEYINGKTSGNLVGYSFFGEKKKIAAQQWMEKNNINPKDVSFYSDSYTDIPLLEYCGYPVAVNPDRILQKRAKQYNWKILKFKKTLGSNYIEI
ncbi:MAG: HAD-IB family hydrolase [Treponema sp.]|nr:HAD-IB family hydrolase [Treponema sp.]